MEQNQIHILKEKIKEHTAYRDYAEHQRKKSLYRDNFYDADKYEAERDEEQAIIDRLRTELELYRNKEQGVVRTGSYYIQCAHCEKMIHQRMLRNHKCNTSSVTAFNKRLES